MSRPLHRAATHRLRQHVEAERPLIAPVERFEVDDSGVDRPVPVRPDHIGRKALRPDARDMRFLLRRGDDLGEADALDARIILRDPEAADIGVPLVARDRTPGVEHADAAAQHLLVGEQAAGDMGADALRLGPEARCGLVMRFAARTVPSHGGDGGREEENGERPPQARADKAGRQAERARRCSVHGTRNPGPTYAVLDARWPHASAMSATHERRRLATSGRCRRRPGGCNRPLYYGRPWAPRSGTWRTQSPRESRQSVEIGLPG